MVYFIYTVLVSLAAPLGALWLLARPRYRPLLGRFAPAVSSPAPGDNSRPLWIHACSVGEVNIARPIIAAVRARWPRLPLLLTTSTISGRDLARDACPGVPLTWLPFDHPLCVRLFLRKARPCALVLLDTELWPALILGARRAGVPVILANGRLSDKHFPRYRRARFFLRPVIARLSAAAMQNEEYAARLTELGARPDAVRVCGSTKFDGVLESVDAEKLRALRRVGRTQYGLEDDAPLLVFGSTRPGDEALAAQCWRTLRDEFPALRLVIAPRHLDRIDEAMAPFDEPIARRSQRTEGADARVFFLDTVGELVDFYALATVAVVGGSFYPGVNGHNPLEPAALGIPTVFGPYMRNFIDPARELLAHNGAVQVSPDELTESLRRLLTSLRERQTLADNGRNAVRANKGAINRTLDLIEPFVNSENE